MHQATAHGAPGAGVPYILAACTAVSVLSTDLFTPSIPDLPAVFGTDIIAAQMAVSINLLAYALAQLVHGPIADSIGRRRLLLLAFTAFTLISAFCALSVSMEMLLLGRFLQGLLSSVPSVVIILIIRELYSSEKAVGVMAMYGAALGLAPAIGPLLGGYLHVWFGWSASFWVIAVLSMITAFLFYRNVPETLSVQRPLSLIASLRQYGQLLTRGDFLAQLVPLSAIFGAFYAFVTSGPVVFIDLLGLPTEHYGLTYIMIIVAFILGNMTAGRLSRSWNAQQIVQLAIRCTAFGAILLLLPSMQGIDSIPMIVGAMSIYAVGLGMILAAGPIVLLDQVADLPAGPASALLGAGQLGAASLAGFLTACYYSESSLSMAATFAGFVLIGALPAIFVAPKKVRG